MKTILIAAALALGLAAAGGAQASEELAKANGCMTCHNVTGKKMGPGLKDVGAKYKSADEQAKLIEKFQSGKGHPASKAKPDDVKKILAWMAS